MLALLNYSSTLYTTPKNELAEVYLSQLIIGQDPLHDFEICNFFSKERTGFTKRKQKKRGRGRSWC